MSETAEGLAGEIVPLDAAEEAFWRTFARAILVIPRSLDADQRSGSGLSTAEYGVLMSLSESPERRMRINEIALHIGMSASRVSRIVGEFTRLGYTNRCTSEQDRRAQIAELTDAGLARLEEAWPAHLRSVRRRVMQHVDPAELPHLTEMLARMVTYTNPADPDICAIVDED
jgi:DNA-binding MarR family transcriptional regulator